MKSLHILHKCFIKFSKRYSRKNLYRFLEDAIDKYCCDGLNIINIGAGGEIRKILKKHNVNFIEIDIDPKRNPDIVASVEDLSMVGDESVDIYFLMEVLEHVENPFKAIEEIRRTLKKGGLVIASTPFVFPIHDEPYDFYRYTKYGIQKLFKDFELIVLKERNSYIESVFVVLVRLINIGSKRQKIVGILLFPVYVLLLPLFKLLSFIVDNYQSTTGYFYIFRK